MVQDDALLGEDREDFERILFMNEHSYSQSKKGHEEQQGRRQQSSLVVIRDFVCTHKDDLSVFPPINHENLHIPRNYCDHNQRSSFSFSTADSACAHSQSIPSDSLVQVPGGITNWWDFLRCKILRIASWFLYCSTPDTAGAFSPFYPALGVGTLVIWWWLCARARRRRYEGETVDHLRLIIKEKDEKISRLLHQIAQMNELLVARHKVLASQLSK